jgi:hypothetical protein
MTKSNWFRSRDFAALLFVLVLAVGGALAWWRFPAAESEDAEAAAEFRTQAATEAKTVAAMIAETKAGTNISETRLGMFMMNLLSGLAEEDDGLGTYFHRDGRLMQDYLTDQFQYHSEEEVARVAALAAQGKPAIRQSARYALEALRHIPVSKDPPETQAADRAALAAALTALDDNLIKAAGK